MIRHLGYACINNTLRKNGVFTGRTLRQSNFSIERVGALALANCHDLLTILRWNAENNIKFFRLSSDLFPFADHPTLGYSLESLPSFAAISSVMRSCRDLIFTHGMRISSHPSHFVCLASENPFTFLNSIATIRLHQQIGKLLGLKNFVINIHVGGTYGGDFQKTADRFLFAFDEICLDKNSILTLENDDKPNGWTVEKLHKYICGKNGIPIVFDTHHWQFCQEDSMANSGALALSTWHSFGTPKMHYSESADGKKPQAHSHLIQNEIPDLWPDTFDVMIEAKGKEEALLHYRNKFGFKGGEITAMFEEKFGPLPKIQVEMLHTKEVGDFMRRIEEAHELSAKSTLIFRNPKDY